MKIVQISKRYSTRKINEKFIKLLVLKHLQKSKFFRIKSKDKLRWLDEIYFKKKFDVAYLDARQGSLIGGLQSLPLIYGITLEEGE